jgi:hypothetical protein
MPQITRVVGVGPVAMQLDELRQEALDVVGGGRPVGMTGKADRFPGRRVAGRERDRG